MTEFNHWRIEREAGGLAWLTFDKAGESTNTLSAQAMLELSQALDEFDREPPKGLVIRSGKSAGFIAGADIEEFTKVESAEGAKALVQRGWDLYNRLAAVKYPTLALIRGHCMGGGTELALACRYRIAVDEPGTRIALPEVMLGIVPGWGGMLRLPQVIGAAPALDMMLTGRALDAKKAKRLGFADECVPPRVMENAARMLVLSGHPRRQLPFMQRMMNGPLKGVVASQAKKQVAARARPEHYPAPYAILDMWANYGGNALAVPAGKPTSMEAIAASLTTKNLVRVYYLQERLKGFGKDSDFAPKHLHVIGAGVMGGDIAAWAALRGLTVTLQDQSIERIAPAIHRAAIAFKRKLRDDTQVRFALDRLIPDPSGQGVRQADVVIEAIFENLEAKQKLFADIEAIAKPDAVLASNTSSLRLEDIAAGLKHPSRLIGIHFFNPVAKMPLVEVVEGRESDPQALKKGLAFVRKIDKLALPVKSVPGFLVNAVLAPYMQEAMRCVDEGIAPEVVDEAALAFGMPLGPIELADTVGLDIAVAAGQQLASGISEPPKKLMELVSAGHLGRKTGRGFYTYNQGKPQKGAVGQMPAGLADRLIKPFLAAAQRCVEQGVVADAELADAGVIFGTGFAPFRGGPMNYLKERTA
ncbi:3-hydroxyacyl-CoA dehydrogenase / enoyl-CoA hydratase / 3-hydroxybutyryl-CoA epimerase [Rhodocyclaceae bacterium]|jgi:3-hydroxyacyl-CoA dehydrogenase/enoyl-CoA hydratase/3-hydroxybutyryl-CoA epimerase|nr:3-hydroxyacyl-CoA dehydrogenase / enoyl-CoA hydratase / 3-hydroxybutyryl-CoA epimerase [Rhodocyclaceae bacterium]